MLRSFLNRWCVGSTFWCHNRKRPSFRPTVDSLEERAVLTVVPVLANPGYEPSPMLQVAIGGVYFNPKELKIDQRDASSASRPAMEGSPPVAFSFNGLVTFGGTSPNSTRGATSAAVDLNG